MAPPCSNRFRVSRYGGTIHDFVLLNPITNTQAPRAAISQAGEPEVSGPNARVVWVSLQVARPEANAMRL